MKHLVNHSVYAVSGKPPSLVKGDGFELLTGFFDIDPSAWPDAVSVHLPYVVDWYSVWKGRLNVEDMTDDDLLFFSYGRSRGTMVDNIRTSIEKASVLKPAYGVIHAGSANIDELFSETYSDSDNEVLFAFAELINEAVSTFPKGEPPFKLMFENQWWPGLRMLDGKNYKILKDKIEFENWGLCLDTGHLLVTTQRSRDELQAIDLLAEIFEKYPQDMLDDIGTIHLHVNTSADYIKNYDEPKDFLKMSIGDRLKLGYGFVGGMDQHRPFSVKEVRRITDILKPDYVTHEMGAPDTETREKQYLQQRSLFK